MTMQDDLGQNRKFVSTFLPWLIALGAFLFYLLTLNHWVSINGVSHTARAMGMMWTADVFQPFYFTVTCPFSWLPARWVPLAFGLFSTLCAVLTLALLARSVALLPHDRTYEQRQREQSAFSLLSVRGAWIPPV